MKNKKSLLKKIAILGLLALLFTFAAYPNQAYGEDAAISIYSDIEEIKVGNEVAFTYELDSGDISIVSIDLVFSYDPEFLEFQDGDTKQTGLQISTTSSAFNTVTKKIVDKDAGELKFSGSKIGGVSSKSILFKAVFKALKTGTTSLNLDKTLSKIFDTKGTKTFSFNPTEVKIQESTEPTNEDDPEADSGESTGTDSTSEEGTASEDGALAINHTVIPKFQANLDFPLQVTIDPTEKVKEARLYYKNSIDESFTPIKMGLKEDNEYEGIIPKEKVVIGELKYFFGIIDTEDGPHRYPAEDNIFFTAEITLSDEVANNGTQGDIDKNSEENTNPGDYQANLNNDYNQSKNTETGPGTVFLLIGAIAFVFLYIMMKENSFEKK